MGWNAIREDGTYLDANGMVHPALVPAPHYLINYKSKPIACLDLATTLSSGLLDNYLISDCGDTESDIEIIDNATGESHIKMVKYGHFEILGNVIHAVIDYPEDLEYINKNDVSVIWHPQITLKPKKLFKTPFVKLS